MKFFKLGHFPEELLGSQCFINDSRVRKHGKFWSAVEYITEEE